MTYNRNIYAPGTLYDLYMRCKEAKDSPGYMNGRLKEQELSRLVEIYAAAPPGTDYLAIDNDQTLVTPEGNKVTGRDFKAMLSLVYSHSRGEYADIKQIENTSFNCAVPLGLLAYRNYYNKNYDDFRLDPSYFKVEKNSNIKVALPAAEGGLLAKVFNLDLLLGKAFASTSINKEGSLQWNTTYGLARLCALGEVRRPVEAVQDLREPSFGRRRGHYTRGYGANILKVEDYPEEFQDFIVLYNKCNQTIKHLLLQRWIFYAPSNTNMIANITTWDKLPKSLDDVAPKVPVNLDIMGDIFGL